jgi:hypothetical protein
VARRRCRLSVSQSDRCGGRGGREAAAAKEVEAAICALFDAPARAMLEKALALRAELDPLVSALSALFASGIGKVPTEYGVSADGYQKLQAALPHYSKPPGPIEVSATGVLACLPILCLL